MYTSIENDKKMRTMNKVDSINQKRTSMPNPLSTLSEIPNSIVLQFKGFSKSSNSISLTQLKSFPNIQKNHLLPSVKSEHTYTNVVQRMGADGRMASTEMAFGIFPGANHAVEYPGLPVPMTYHHIIPRNKLSEFWNAMNANGDLDAFKWGFLDLATQAKERVTEPGYRHRHNPTLFEAGGIEFNVATMMNEYDKIHKKDARHRNGEIWNSIELIFQWWPANIHQGPTARRVGHDPLTDDGGDDFEQSAQFIVSSKVYNSLSLIYQYMKNYITTKDKNKVKAIAVEIKKLKSVTQITRYNPAKWERKQDLWLVRKD